MAMLGGLIGLIALVVWVYALFDALTAPARECRYLPKPLWVLLILALLHIGAVMWLVLGRPRTPRAETPAEAPQAPPAPSGEPGLVDPSFGGVDDLGGFGGSASPTAAPKGPDDDPDFLRGLDRRINPDRTDDD
ncbi:MAG: hypothetical protein GEV11_06380 [Streptosporangiales bacterium]|nr:hypothetical protein [Streptosporangiales bacterium]